MPTVSGPLPPGISLGDPGSMIVPGGDAGVVGNPYFDNGASSFNPYPVGDDYGGPNGGYGGGGFDPGGYAGGYFGGGYYGDEGDEGGGFWSGLGGAAAAGIAAGTAFNTFGGRSGAGARNLPAELSGILALGPVAAGSTAATQARLNPFYTQLNSQNFNTALANVSPNLRTAYDQANPGLASYTQGLGGVLERLNAQGQDRVHPTGYAAFESTGVNAGPAAQANFSPARFNSAGPAAQANFSPAQAYQAQLAQAAQQRAAATTAAQQRASGGPLLGRLQGDAMGNLGRVSGLQAQQQRIAQGLLTQGGNLSAQETRQVQQDTRGAFAARGLFDSNQAIGAEIMNTDAARRARLTQNLGIAQGVDASGQQQITNNRGYALGVQGQGQNLSQFNSAQGNQLGQYNSGLLTNTSQFNAGQGNALGTFNAGQANDISRFNAAQQQQNSQFNSGLGAQVSQFNAGSRNNMAQFDASQQNQLGQYNAGLGAQVSQYNAGAQNQMGQFNTGLSQQNNQYNTGAHNQAQQYNVGAVNQMALFNAQAGAQNQNDQWAREMQLGNFQLGQAINPTPVGMGLMGQTPDYTSGLLGYGSDLYNTNFNASSAQNISRNNNNAALAAAGINALYNIYGRG